MLEGKEGATPDVRWLLLVAHDTNIAMVRTLMDFSWQLPGYSRGNIPPGSSTVLERWRDTHSGKRYLRVYFQAQSLDDLRRLQIPDSQHPLLRQWRQPLPDDRRRDLCPYRAALTTSAGISTRTLLRRSIWFCRDWAIVPARLSGGGWRLT